MHLCRCRPLVYAYRLHCFCAATHNTYLLRLLLLLLLLLLASTAAAAPAAVAMHTAYLLLLQKGR